MFFRNILVTGVLVSLVTPFVVLAATSDNQYRLCLQEAMLSRENRFLDVQVEYNRQSMDILNERRTRLFDLWNVEDDRSRTSSIKDVERNYGVRIRDLQRWVRDETRRLETDYRNADKNCRGALQFRDKNRKYVPVNKECRVSDECYNPLGACTTEFGDCRNGNPCMGICVVR